MNSTSNRRFSPFHGGSSMRAARQKGSVIVNAAIALSLIIIVLAGTELGYLFYMKREYQKAADLAALAGASQLNGPTGCQGARQAARTNANGAGVSDPIRNLPTNFSLADGNITCGRWDPGIASESHFDDKDPNLNAVRVLISNAPVGILSVFPGNRTIRVQAIAAKASDPLASFSVGSGVARLQEGALNSLLTMLLGTSVNLTLIDYKGLANAKINLLGLAKALNLNLGSYDELLAANVSLGQLITAAINALPQSNDSPTVKLVTSLLNGLLSLDGGLDLDRTTINLLKTAQQAGLISVDLDPKNPSSALNGEINALNLLLVSLQVANSNSAAAAQVTIPLDPLANVQVKATVIEPPSIAIGPPGYYSDGRAKTEAHTGQVRVLLNAKVLTPPSGGNLLNLDILGLASIKVSLPAGQLVNLPIYVEVASGDGELEDVSCKAADGKYDVKIGVMPGLAHVYLGNIPTAFTNRTAKWSALPKERFDLLNVKAEIKLLFGLIPVADAPIGLKAKLDLSIPGDDTTTRTSQTFRFDPKVPAADQDLVRAVGSEQHLGAAIGSAIGAGKLDVKLDTSGLTVLGIPADGLSSIIDGLVNNLVTIVGGVLGLLNAVLMPVLNLLDGAVLGPLLKTLGLQLGYADVQLLSASCDSGAKLVY